MSALVDSNYDLQSAARGDVSRSFASDRYGAIIFYGLALLIPLTAIPYGAAEPWWKALFECLVFALAGFSVLQKLLSKEQVQVDWSLALPLFVLIGFAFLQTIPGLGGGKQAISADASQTKVFIVELAALALVVWLISQYAVSQRRLRRLVEMIIVTGFLTAAFGIVRQLSQHNPGFLLPALKPGFGYGQFINRNHFAFVMEMALGLALGIVAARGVTGRRMYLYLLAAAPMWLAVVLSTSRGGIFSILFQAPLLGFVLLRGFRRAESTHAAENFERSWLRTLGAMVIRAVLIVALLSAAIFTVVLLGGDPLAARIDSVQDEFSRNTADSYVLRQSIWRATWDLIKDHSVAGVGFGGYWIAITKYHHASGEVTPQQAANDYLELLASGGVIGVAIVIWLTLMFIRRARRNLVHADRFRRAVALGALAGILTVSVHSLVEFGLHITVNAFLFAALAALVVIDPEHCLKSRI